MNILHQSTHEPARLVSLTETEAQQLASNLAALPSYCYAAFMSEDPGKRIGIIKAGQEGHAETREDRPEFAPAAVWQRVDALNEALRVTREQADAMQTGSAFGFHVRGAHPDMHTEPSQDL